MRSFSLSEELLPVDPLALRPDSLTAEMVLRYESCTRATSPWNRPSPKHGVLSVGLFGGQIHVVGPKQSFLSDALETVRIGRALADRAARSQGRRAVALGSPVFPFAPVRPEDATRLCGPALAAMPRDPSLCGLHLHVDVCSPEEGVQVLDRIRVWLPVLLALSTNSPFWHGLPSRLASHRYFSCSKWPAQGPSEVFGSAGEYERQRRHLTHPAAARWSAATNRDAQLSATRETLDVLLADVCLDAEQSAVLGAVTRALVEVMSRQWQMGTPPAPASVAELRASSWVAAVNGLEGTLMSPSSGHRAPVGDVLLEFLALLRPVLRENHEWEQVESVIVAMLRHGNGSRYQRDAYARRQDPHDVVEAALWGTHDPNHSHGVPGAILAESWGLAHIEELPALTAVG